MIACPLLCNMTACAWIYILTNKNHSALYVGVTNNLPARLSEHRTKQDTRSFTARYNITKLVYYEGFDSILNAIAREKYIKRKRRKWKDALIRAVNPEWEELRPPR